MFDDNKKKALDKKKADKSKKGHIDSQIKPLVDMINSLPDFYTTSSCAGRTVFLERISKKKYDSNWLFISHEPINFEDINKSLKITKNKIWFKAEPPIVHLCARTVDAAQKFLAIAKQAGFKRSGIISINDSRIVIELIGSVRVDTLIAEEGRLLITKDYLSVLVREANTAMEINRRSLRKMKELISKEL